MTRRVRIGLAALGRMGRIHAASLAARCPSAEQSWRSGRTVTVAAQRSEDGVHYLVKQESQ